jgi:replication factor A1
MSVPLLSDGIISEIVYQDRLPAGPTLQIVKIEELPSKQGTNKRFRVALSDGRNYIPGIGSQQMNNDIANRSIKTFNVIRLNEYSVNDCTGKKVIIILNFDVIPNAPTGVLGSPLPIRDEDGPPRVVQTPAASLLHPSAPPSFPVAGSSVRSTPPERSANRKVVSISALNSYVGSSWEIRAKIVQKSTMLTWANERGTGNLFSIILKDKSGKEIRGTFFKVDADHWYERLELDKVYTVTGGRVKPANAKFSTVQNDYEITFDSNTSFEEVQDDSISGGRSYRFLGSLRDVLSQKENSVVDVVAIVKEIRAAMDIATKKGQARRRSIILCDSSRAQIELALWDNYADSFPEDSVSRVVQIKDVRVTDFQGKQLSSTRSTALEFLATSPRAHELQRWWTNRGERESFESLSSGGGGSSCAIGPLSAINERRLGTRKDTTDSFAFYGVLCEV